MMTQSYLNLKRLSLEPRHIKILTEDNDYVFYDTEKPLFYILNTFLNIKECFISFGNL